MRFRSAYSGQQREFTNSGEIMQNEYGYKINAKGEKVLAKTGERNLNEEIQSYAEEVKIENILKKAAIGDMSDFREDGIYQDITNIPNNLIEAKKEIVKLENTWNKLPTEVKAKYNWSMDEFMAKSGEDAWMIDLGLKQPAEPEKVTLKEETKIEVPKETN